MSVYNKGYFKRWLNCLLPIFTLCSLYFFFIPIETIQDNQRFLNVSPDKIWMVLLAVTLGLTVVITSVLAAVKNNVGRIVTSVLAGIILASFVQMLFLNSELSVLNGAYPAWKSNTWKIILNLVFWIILVGLPVIVSLFKKDLHSLVTKVICLAVLASQIVSVGSMAISGETKSLNDTSYVLNGREQYTVSSKENMFVFSLDTLSKDIFEAITTLDAEVTDGLKDFTYYSNACGTYTTTFPAIVGLLTGTEYLGDVSYKDYFSQAWNSEYTNSFYSSLHKNGYKVNLFLDEYLTEESGDLVGKADNIIRADKQIKLVLYTRLLRISFYRLLPFCLKEYALVTPQGTVMTADLLNKAVDIIPIQDSNEKYESIRKDMSFYDDLINRGIEIDDENNIFAWTHMIGAHTPYTTNARCEYEPGSSPINQATGYIYALEKFFDEMKEAGVYDNSTLIITADHGADLDENYSLFVPILIKLPGETHDDMTINSAAVSLGDLTPTLLSFVSSEDMFGKTLFEFEEGEPRERVLRRLYALKELDVNSWSEENSGTYNALLEYRFIGDQEDLNDKIDHNQYKAIPIVDSFY